MHAHSRLSQSAAVHRRNGRAETHTITSALLLTFGNSFASVARQTVGSVLTWSSARCVISSLSNPNLPIQTDNAGGQLAERANPRGKSVVPPRARTQKLGAPPPHSPLPKTTKRNTTLFESPSNSKLPCLRPCQSLFFLTARGSKGAATLS